MSAPTLVDLRGALPDAAGLASVAVHVRSGGVIAYPTETVYGFGGAVTEDSVDRVRRLKRREEDRPLLVLVRGIEEAASLRWTPEARELAQIFWPGALTLVLADPEAAFPPGVRSREGTVAVRVSPHPLVAALLEAVGGPLTSTSANVPGGAPAQDARQALEAAALLGCGEEMLVLDGGGLPPSPPSTLVDCTGPEVRVLRNGSIPLERLRCAIPGLHGR